MLMTKMEPTTQTVLVFITTSKSVYIKGVVTTLKISLSQVVREHFMLVLWSFHDQGCNDFHVRCLKEMSVGLKKEWSSQAKGMSKFPSILQPSHCKASPRNPCLTHMCYTQSYIKKVLFSWAQCKKSKALLLTLLSNIPKNWQKTKEVKK